MKKVVVSAIFGGHDYIKDPIFYNPDWEYILFTDDDTIISKYWDVRYMGGNRQTARDIKIRTHKYIQYSVRLWVDASFVLKCDPEEVLTAMGDADALFKIHPVSETTADEIRNCVKFKRIQPEQSEELVKYFKTLDFDIKSHKNGVVYETGFNMMRNSSDMIGFCDFWYQNTVNCLLRDQVALPYSLYVKKPKTMHFTDSELLAWAGYSKHNKAVQYDEINYVQPYAIDGNLGRGYNLSCRGMDDDEWICILDQDVCFLDSRQKLWISKTIAENPNYDIFSCMTNRLARETQVYKQMHDERDIIRHKQMTLKAWDMFGTKVVDVDEPLAGLFMLMKVRTLKSVEFKNGLLYLDTDFYTRAVEMGFKVGLMKGIYLFHYYRLAEGKTNTSHLRRVDYK